MLVSVPNFWGWHTQTTAVEIAGADGKQTSQCCAAPVMCGCLEADDDG